MYRVLEITYDLDTTNEPDYDGLTELLEQMDYCHAFYSTWYICTKLTESELSQRVLPFMNGSDKWRVNEVTTVGAGRMPKPSWDWLTTRLARCKKGPVLKSSLPKPIKVDIKKMFK